jgi:SAM-dependent methyltransferase
MAKVELAAGSGSSVLVKRCQICDNAAIRSVFFLGYLPPVNRMHAIGQRPFEEAFYPAEWLFCPRCQLVQLGLVVDKNILFPPEYPYSSGTTRILRENFAEMYRETQSLFPLKKGDLVVDVGSNDGTLLSNFQKGGYRVRGIEPTDMGRLANQRGIPTTIAFMGREVAQKLKDAEGPAAVVAATNVFAHMEDIHQVLESIILLLADDGLFVSESHYLMSLLETVQYDTIYHEHLRHYNLTSLQYLLNMHGLEVVHARRIPTHGGSIRAYAARRGKRNVQPSVAAMLAEEAGANLDERALEQFRRNVIRSKMELLSLLAEVKNRRQRVFGISAPSRASTLITYVGLDEGILDCVVEVKGSHKIGKYMPGTLIPVLEEDKLFSDQPEYALLLSWHIADELIPKLKDKGYRGKFVIPLPLPRVV